MATSDDIYYSLRFVAGDALHGVGDRLLSRADTLLIGQSESADLQVAGDGLESPMPLAVVLRSGDTWCLVPQSRIHVPELNGSKVDIAAALETGDTIRFAGLPVELVFKLHNDGDFKAAGTVSVIKPRMRARTIAMIAALPVVLCALLYFLIGVNHMSELTDDMCARARRATMMLQVDSLVMVRIGSTGDTLVLERYDYSTEESGLVTGTAFVSADSQLITARHCLEPWLNDANAINVTTPDELSTPSRMAMEAETMSQLDTAGYRYMVLSRCSLYATDSVRTLVASLRSEDFDIDRSRDEIIELGDYDRVYFWRGIAPRYGRSDMMLGDIAVCDAPAQVIDAAGSLIPVARRDELPELATVGRPVTYIGYPMAQDIVQERARGEITVTPKISADGIPASAIGHNGDIGPGFSGGPVLVRGGSEGFCAVGVVSVTDFLNGKRSYSVPVCLGLKNNQHEQ